MPILNVPIEPSSSNRGRDPQQNTGLGYQSTVEVWGQDNDGDTHWNSLPKLMGGHQLRLDKKGASFGPK